MAEFDTIEITNPTKDDFSARWNGELYSLRAGEKRAWPMSVAFHMTKHLTSRMLEKEADKLRSEYKESVYVPQVGTLMNHDNPSRRIAVYDVVGSKDLVDEFFKAIALKSFVGDMSIYDTYVAKKEAKSEPAPADSTGPANAGTAKKSASKSE